LRKQIIKDFDRYSATSVRFSNHIVSAPSCLTREEDAMIKKIHDAFCFWEENQQLNNIRNRHLC